MPVVVIMPARDEGPRIGDVIATLPEIVGALIVIDDGSTDHISKVALEAGLDAGFTDHGTFCTLKIISGPEEGPGAAVKAGVLAADSMLGVRKEWDLVVLDADGQIPPTAIQSLLDQRLKVGADIGKGTRDLSDRFGSMPRWRRFWNRVISWLARRASGFEVQDSQCGLVIMPLSLAVELVGEVHWPGYGYPAKWLTWAGNRGLRLTQSRIVTIYGGEVSHLRPLHLLTPLSFHLLAALLKRGWNWYVRGKGPQISKILRFVVVLTWCFPFALAVVGFFDLIADFWVMGFMLLSLFLCDRLDLRTRKCLTLHDSVQVL